MFSAMHAACQQEKLNLYIGTTYMQLVVAVVIGGLDGRHAAQPFPGNLPKSSCYQKPLDAQQQQI